nr:s-adenosylmethionine carrier 1 (SAMC1) [Polytomella parva]
MKDSSVQHSSSSVLRFGIPDIKNVVANTRNAIIVAATSSEPKTYLKSSASNGTEEKKDKVLSWRNTLANVSAGATAGCAVEAALYPIDTIKTRLQSMIGGGGFKALLQQGGGKGLYAGIFSNLLGVAPASAVFMAFYEPLKNSLKASLPSDRSYQAALIAGAVGGAASSLIRVPTEVIKQRIQTREFHGLVDAVRGVTRTEGLRGLYAGYGAFMLRDLPFDAIQFAAYEKARSIFRTVTGREASPAETSVIGACVGGFTAVITTPLDVMKTRLMTQGATGKYSGLLDCVTRIVKEEGPSALMCGWQPRLLWISLGGFVFFPVLETSKNLYGQLYEAADQKKAAAAASAAAI